MIQINLLPDIKIVYLKIRRLRIIVFLVAVFVITICTIALLLLGVTTLVQQKNDILYHQERINAYVKDFNGENGRDVRKYLSIQSKFQSLGQLKAKKIDANRIWSNGLFGGGERSFLPPRYLENVELYDFNFDTGEFTIAGAVEGGGDDINFRDYFLYAYYEIKQVDENGQESWSCPLATRGELGNAPDWTYCRMFSDIEANSEFHPELDAQRKVTVNGLFTTEVPGTGTNLFAKDVEMRVRVPSGCSDIACIARPDPGENEPQDFVNP